MNIGGRLEAEIIVPSLVSITATNNGVGPTTVSITAGTYSGITALLAHVVARLNAVRTPATWTGTLSTGANGTGKVSLNWTGAGTYSIAWTASGATLRDILGFTADLTAVTQGVASVSPNQARGLWLPDCPLACDGDPSSAPRHSDRRTVVTPNGKAYTHAGNEFYRLKNLRYSHVPQAKIWERLAVAAGLANSSFETFWRETQLGLSSSWFAAGSRLQVYWSNGGVETPAGSYANAGAGLSGWYIGTPKELDEVTLSVPQWTGYYMVTLGDLVSDG